MLFTNQILQFGSVKSLLISFIGISLSILLSHTRAFAADIKAGEVVFQQCAGCHMVGKDAQHRFGPQLNGLQERGAGRASEYVYSEAIMAAVESGLDWNVSLDEYLASPLTNLPGTKMAFPGLPSAVDRSNVIAYILSFDSNGSTNDVSNSSGNNASLTRDSETTHGDDEKGPQTAESKKKDRLARVNAAPPEHGVLHLGRVALAKEIQAWDIDIRPDGTGLPDGRGTVADGGLIYDAKCASCHGVFGEGAGRWPVLAGGVGTLTEERPEKTIGSYWPYVSTLYDYVRRAMPFGNARSLSDEDVYAVTAYLLYLNDIVDEDFELNPETFSGIDMPNVDGFVEDTRQQEGSFERTIQAEVCMNDCYEEPAKILQTARTLDVTPDKE